MIDRININNTSKFNNYSIVREKQDEGKQNPNFKGAGAMILSGIQMCERMPMVNVTVIDMLSAILPRTIVESTTNWFAGFEAFRRESSGLVVNCLIPSFITLGIAKCLNPLIMPKGVNMSGCWADSSLIDKAEEYYKQANSEDKVKESLKRILGNIEGSEGKNHRVVFKDALSEKELEDFSQRLADLSRSGKDKKSFKKDLNKIAEEIVNKTKISEHVKIADGKEVKALSVESMLRDSVKFYEEFQRKNHNLNIEEFAKKSKTLVKSKSLMGLAVVLPLAMSMQYINRWITSKISGVKGAPIYDDFGKNGQPKEMTPEEKRGLLKQKLISISSMLGVSLLSMMKMPSMNMLEFKGIFPTMDQARIISTSTFASRMAAAEDKNELAESTIRDIATFSGLYFLGDYAAKGAATIIQNHTGVTLLNETKQLKENANLFQKAWHWIKDINVKSSEEVTSKTQEMLKKKGLTPDAKQLEMINKELKKATNLRSVCQIANLGVSLVLLGIIVPIFTRKNTKKKHELALKQAQESHNIQVDNNKTTININK